MYHWDRLAVLSKHENTNCTCVQRSLLVVLILNWYWTLPKPQTSKANSRETGPTICTSDFQRFPPKNGLRPQERDLGTVLTAFKKHMKPARPAPLSCRTMPSKNAPMRQAHLRKYSARSRPVPRSEEARMTADEEGVEAACGAGNRPWTCIQTNVLTRNLEVRARKHATYSRLIHTHCKIASGGIKRGTTPNMQTAGVWFPFPVNTLNFFI